MAQADAGLPAVVTTPPVPASEPEPAPPSAPGEMTLVEHLVEGSPEGRRAFPRPAAMAAADASFYREGARSGYRAPALPGPAAPGAPRRGRRGAICSPPARYGL